MTMTFGATGLLPPYDFELSLEALKESILVTGPKAAASNWDKPWRELLVGNLEVLCRQLWKVGVRDIFVDGSFAEDKDHPLMLLASGKLQQELNLLDPYKIWTWDPATRRPFRGYPKSQLPMWHRYRVELYPHVPGLGSGIQDKHGNELEFPAAFRQTRGSSEPKGIVRIRYGGTK